MFAIDLGLAHGWETIAAMKCITILETMIPVGRLLLVGEFHGHGNRSKREGKIKEEEPESEPEQAHL